MATTRQHELLIEELAGAMCAEPFKHLGLHSRPDGPGLLLRAWVPDCERVEVVDTARRRRLGEMEIHVIEGLWDLQNRRPGSLPVPFERV